MIQATDCLVYSAIGILSNIIILIKMSLRGLGSSASEFIPKMIDGSDYDSYYMTLAELTTRIHDSHAYVLGKNRETVTDYFGLYQLPVNFIEINNQIVISKVINKCVLEVGDIVLNVGDDSIDELLENRRKYISQSREDTATLFFLHYCELNRRIRTLPLSDRKYDENKCNRLSTTV